MQQGLPINIQSSGKHDYVPLSSIFLSSFSQFRLLRKDHFEEATRQQFLDKYDPSNDDTQSDDHYVRQPHDAQTIFQLLEEFTERVLTVHYLTPGEEEQYQIQKQKGNIEVVKMFEEKICMNQKGFLEYVEIENAIADCHTIYREDIGGGQAQQAIIFRDSKHWYELWASRNWPANNQ